MPTSFRDHTRSLTEIELAESLEHHAALTASATAQAVTEEARGLATTATFCRTSALTKGDE